MNESTTVKGETMQRTLDQRPHSIVFEGKGRTKQQDKDACDVNMMMAKYQRTGVLPGQNNFAPQYGDFSNVSDYQTAVQQIKEAETDFAALPSKIRGRFNNDPLDLINFMTDEANRDEAIKLGLMPETDPVVETPEVIPPITEAEPKAD